MPFAGPRKQKTSGGKKAITKCKKYCSFTRNMTRASRICCSPYTAMAKEWFSVRRNKNDKTERATAILMPFYMSILTGWCVQRVVYIIRHPGSEAPVVGAVLQQSENTVKIMLAFQGFFFFQFPSLYQHETHDLSWGGGGGGGERKAFVLLTMSMNAGCTHLKDVAQWHGSVRETMDEQRLQQPLHVVERVTHAGEAATHTRNYLEGPRIIKAIQCRTWGNQMESIFEIVS